MDYKVTIAKGGDAYRNQNRGYELYEDDKRYFSVFMRNGTPDPATWASLNRHLERDMPVFTREYCEYQGIDRKQYDTITIID